MTKIELVELIGEVLTEIDRCLSGPDLSQDSSEWHQLFALRKALDDQQRDLVRAIFQEDDAEFLRISGQISALNGDLVATLNDIRKIASTVATVTKIVGAVGQLLNLVHL